MKLRCPVCHCTFSLEAIVASDAGRDLLIALAEQGQLFRPLVQYIGLFRTAQRDLSYTKALKLVNEVVELGIEPDRLAIALHDTVEAIHAKRQQGTAKPFKNHNYLLSVIESTPQPDHSLMPCSSRMPGKVTASKRNQAVIALQQWAGDDWLRQEIGAGLARLIVRGRKGAPAADTIVLTASEFEDFLVRKNQNIREIDQPRLQAGFNELLNNYDDWPEPKDLYARLPRRPERNSLAQPVSDEERQSAKEFFAAMARGEYAKTTENNN